MGPKSTGQTLVRRLMELSGERRIAPFNLYGETMSRGRRSVRFFASLTAALGSIALLGWLLFNGEPCNGVLFDVEFAGTSERFADRYEQNPVCDVSAMRSVIARDLVFSLFYAAVLALFLTVWWNASWVTEPGFSAIPGTAFAAVAGAAFVSESTENLIAIVGLENDGDGVTLRFARLIFTLGWIKWTFVATLIAAMVAVTLSWLLRASAVVYARLRGDSGVDHLPAVEQWTPGDEQPQLGICLSGGGIRSAAFSLGALSALEETEVEHQRPGQPPGVLGQADLLASVSGGGYAASCWRTAVGFGTDAIIDRPIIGNPNHYSPARTSSAPANPVIQPFFAKAEAAAAEADSGPDDIFPKLRDHRDYLRNGRGGMLLSSMIVVVQMVWHLFLTLALLAIVAWPIGRLIRSWLITTPLDVDGTVVRSVEYFRLATPTFGLLGVLGLVSVVRSFTHRGPLRRAIDAVSLGLLGLAATLCVSLVLLPWMVLELLPALDSLVPGSTAANSTLATILSGSVVASMLRLVRAPLQSRALYLGGALLVVGLVWFALAVASQAVVDEPLIAIEWEEWLLAVVAYIGLVVLTNPDLWSLHWLYRKRLAETFARRWNSETRDWESIATADQPTMSAYAGAPGPKQVICAVAARGERTNTGIPVVSMTFEPDFVAVHCGPVQDEPTLSNSHAIATADYEELFQGRAFGHRYRTVFSATALSAAAVAPSLGRMNLGSTNALIAALNLRLGVWMPNPMFRRGRRATPDLFNMFREIGGSYDLEDPNLYVTDGGHWENLALVELIRRRTEMIISVDASGDKGFSFQALLEAVELAELECATKITLLDGGLEDMRPGERAKPAKNWCRADIRYPDGSTGRLLYVKAQSSEQMPLDILRYSKEDPTFPNYSTADQLLRESEFCNLAILGRESMIAALDDHHGWLFGVDLDGTDLPDGDGPALGALSPDDDGDLIDLSAEDGEPAEPKAMSSYGDDHLGVTATPGRRAQEQLR